MARPKMKTEEKKTKLGISISNEIKDKLELITNNKSKFIEDLLIRYFKTK